MEARVIQEVRPDREYILLGDISGSMTQKDPLCGDQSRYNYMLEKFKLFIKEAAQFDSHGEVDVILFGETIHLFAETTIEKIDSTLNRVQAEGATMTDKALEMAYDRHRAKKKEMAAKGESHPGTVCFVFTDGDPTNKRAVEDVIVDIANHIEREDEFNVTFLTVGTRSNELEAWLSGLHDKVENRISRDFDIIHVERMEKVNFLAAVNTVNHA